MRVDIHFQFARIFNIDVVIDVVVGQKFTLVHDGPDTHRIFADNDPVLSTTPKGQVIEVEATNVGTCEILIMNQGLHVEKAIRVNVLESIPPVAAGLAISADPAQPK